MRRVVNGANFIPSTVLFPHGVEPIRIGARGGRLKDHRVKLYLDRFADWPGAREPF